MVIGILKQEQNCLECGKHCSSRHCLGIHVAKYHPDLDGLYQYALKHIIKEIPFCRCGCGQRVPWKKSLYMFSDYVHGHTGQPKRKTVTLVCHECKCEYTRPSEGYAKKSLFCSKQCFWKSAKNGLVKEKRETTNLERYDVHTPSLLKECNDKMIETRIENFGTVAPIHYHPETKEKFETTMMERHGAKHPLQAAGPKKKRLDTVIKKFGMDPLAMPENRDPEILSAAGQKGYRALHKKMGDGILSGPEKSFAKFLRERFGEKQILQQVPIYHGGRKPWLIDFYIKSLDIYVEMDGVFWHGLEKPYDVLHPKQQKKFDSDRNQDKWFQNKNMKLVRITDEEFLASLKNNDFFDIVSKLGG